jgi:catalase
MENCKLQRRRFLPTNVTSGIDPSDDPIIDTRTEETYAESFGRRTK